MSIQENAPDQNQGAQTSTPTNNKISSFRQVSTFKKVGLTVIGVIICLSGVSVLAGEDPVERFQYELDRQVEVVRELENEEAELLAEFEKNDKVIKEELSDERMERFKRENMLATAKLNKLEDQKLGMLTPADFVEVERLKLKIQPLEVGKDVPKK